MFGRTGERPTIALSMIVRNESAVIRRCLRSVKPLITSWAISDTGSTDGTQDIIREELAGIPGELVERPWLGFTPNRNEALDLARKTGARYLLVIDADEEFTADTGFTLEGLEADTYSAMFRVAETNGRWPRTFLLRADAPLAYAGDMDETIQNDGLDNRLINNCLIVSYPEGFRSRDGLKAKFERDVEVLKASLERDPENPRSWFYLGQRLGGCERLDEAIEAYRKRLSYPGHNKDERYQAQFRIAQIRQQLGHPHDEVLAEYRRAFEEGPDRAEPLFFAGMLHTERGEYATAEVLLRGVVRMPRPIDSHIVLDDIYAWLGNDQLAGVLCQRGKLREARELLTKLVALPQCPESEKPRILENIDLIRKTEGDDVEGVSIRLGRDELAYFEQATLLRRQGLSGLRDFARQYVSRPALQALPGPLRWLWLALLAYLPWVGAAAAVACPIVLRWAAPDLAGLPWLLAGLSPLLWVCGRRRLQDSTIAAITLAGIGFAHQGNPWGLAGAVFALLACKEASLLTLPALVACWLLAGHAAPALGLALLLGVAAWALATFAIFGRMTPAMLRGAASGHATPYAMQYQRGAPHRLLVDLALLSPVPLGLAITGGAHWLTIAATLLIAAHALAPVRNIRLVLAAELMLRGAALVALERLGLSVPHTALILTLWIATDLLVFRRLRHVYDPVTDALAGELGMTRLPSTT